MMSNRSWRERLQAELDQRTTSDRLPRLALIGIGHELCGDDAVGMQIAGMLRLVLAGNERLLVLEAGPAPENFTSVLRRFRPDLVILLDSALMEAEPGAVRWLNWQETEGMSASTHTLPLHILASYLTMELGCAIGLIGIQPGQTFADAPLTPPVQLAAAGVVSGLVDCVNTAHSANVELASS